MERFGDIRRGEFDNDAFLSLGRIPGILETHVGIAAVRSSVLQNRADDSLRQGTLLEEKL